MSIKYHINLETGCANKCTARPGWYRYKDDNGKDSEHYSNITGVQEVYEQSQTVKIILKKILKNSEYSNSIKKVDMYV